MTTFNTGNAVPSGDGKDRFDNSQTFDEVVNSSLETTPTRLGKPIRTMAGFRADFHRFMESTAFELPVDYAAGISITRPTQTLRYLGELYRAKDSAIPFVTTTYAGDSSKLYAIGDAALRQELASDTGSTKVYDKQAVGTTYRRPINEKLDALASIKDYGPSGVGNGVTSDHLAAIAMGAALGYIHFSRGNYVLDTCTLDYPISFDKKANVTVNAGQTVTIRAPISSPKQYILKGAGTYTLTQNNAAAGEDVREVHASWFGAFPSLGDTSDQGPAIARAFAAMGSGRESIVHFDIGGYVINTPVPISRAGWVKGAGTRRTVFKTALDGFPLFVDTASGIAKITDCNFEIPSGSTTRNSPFIEFTYNEYELYNIRMGQSKKGIVASGGAGRISSITAVYGADQGAGSDLINIKGGSGVYIENVQLGTSSAFGPEMVVRIGGTGNLGINYVNISNIYHMTPSISVGIEAFNLNISGVFVDGVQYHGFNGTPPAQVVKIETAGTALVENVNVRRIQAGTRSVAMVSCLQNSSTSMRRIIIDDVQDRRTDGNGIELIRTNGVLEDVEIGAGVQLKTRTNPVYRSGTLGYVRVAAGVEKDSSQVVGKIANIPDDSVYTYDLGKSVFVAGVKVFCATGATFHWGDYIVRAASAPAAFGIQQSASMTTALTALSGTTGTDGKITLGVTDGVLYVENRSGATINMTLSITGT